MSLAYEAMRFRLRLAEDQEQELEDSQEGAREFLRQIALEYREKHPVRPVECASQQVLEGQQGGGNHDVESIAGDPPDLPSVACAVVAVGDTRGPTAQCPSLSGVAAGSEGSRG